jgi:hypothetical protein
VAFALSSPVVCVLSSVTGALLKIKKYTFSPTEITRARLKIALKEYGFLMPIS